MSLSVSNHLVINTASHSEAARKEALYVWRLVAYESSVVRP